jgi:hypothetical protein
VDANRCKCKIIFLHLMSMGSRNQKDINVIMLYYQKILTSHQTIRITITIMINQMHNFYLDPDFIEEMRQLYEKSGIRFDPRDRLGFQSSHMLTTISYPNETCPSDLITSH